ncbi:MAG TPA: alcohol dehydrogenase [Bacteroidetes bacterium]|nr:alcohol dehydrogenase [Bacteroidota bacterium]
MKALVFISVKQALEYKEHPDPIIKDGFAMVELKAAALNRRDWWITQGMYANIKTPSILGSDGCGIYNGEEVIINPSIEWGSDIRFQSDKYKILGMEEDGTFAEKIAVRKNNIYKKPAHLTSEEAAALPLSGLTAYRALFTRCAAEAGDNVLISGVGGGTALMACQFAIAAGANVYVTSGSEDKIKKAVALGAKGGANYKDRDAMKNLGKSAGGFDVVIDSAGGAGFDMLLRMCRKGAQVAIYGGTTGNIEKINVPNLFYKQISIHGSTMGSDMEFKKMLEFVGEYKIVPVIDKVFDLKNGNEAVEMMAGSPQFGKLVLKI